MKQVELKQEQERLKFTDLNYIQAKVEMIKRHAEEVLDSVLNNPNITAEAIAVRQPGFSTGRKLEHDW